MVSTMSRRPRRGNQADVGRNGLDLQVNSIVSILHVIIMSMSLQDRY